MWLTRRDICRLACAAGAAAGAAPARASAGLALRGFDAVSYFLPRGPVAGTAAFEVAWQGLGWRFAGAANRAAFLGDPAAYAPRLGGHDPAGILEGRLVEADPLVFALLGGRLYLFRDAARRAHLLALLAEAPDLLERAERAWPGLDRLREPEPG